MEGATPHRYVTPCAANPIRDATGTVSARQGSVPGHQHPSSAKTSMTAHPTPARMALRV